MTTSYAEWRQHRSCTDKLRHDTEYDANLETLHAWRRGEWRWPYKCRYCPGWHLTSKREST